MALPAITSSVEVSVRRPLLLLPALALAATAVACSSGSGGDEDAAPYVDAIAQSFIDDPTNPWTDEQVRCMSAGIVDVVGVDGFEGAGLTPEDVADDDSDVLAATIGQDEEQADALATAMVGCFDPPGALVATVLEGGAPGEVDEELMTCVGDAVDEADAVTFFRSLVLTDGSGFPTEVEELLVDIAAACPGAVDAFG